MSDIYGRDNLTIVKPITSDYATIEIPGVNVKKIFASSVQIQYDQQVTRRRAIGSTGAIIVPTQPQGTMQLGLFVVEGGDTLSPGTPEEFWQVCKGGSTVTVTLGGGACGAGASGKKYTMTGCVVTSYGLSMEAEGLLITENVRIDFLQMTK